MVFRVEVRHSNQQLQHKDTLFLRFYASELEPTVTCDSSHTMLLWRPKLLCSKCAYLHTLYSGRKATENISDIRIA